MKPGLFYLWSFTCFFTGLVAAAWVIPGIDDFDGVQWSDPGPWILVALWTLTAILTEKKRQTGGKVE